MQPVFDTNIIIDFLNKKTAKAEREFKRYHSRAISVMTWMEVMVGTTDKTRGETEQFLARSFSCLPITNAIARQAVINRKNMRLKLPDAIILATAEEHNTLLVTRNTKDFSKKHPSIRVPYTL